MMRSFLMLLPVLTGVASALQAATNSGMALRTNLSTVLLINIAGTLVAAAALVAVPGARPVWPPAGTPGTLFLGGVYGFIIVIGLAWAFPRFGGAWTIALFVLGQGATALAVDHFGWLGQARDPLSLARGAGMSLVVIGVLLLRWR